MRLSDAPNGGFNFVDDFLIFFVPFVRFVVKMRFPR